MNLPALSRTLLLVGTMLLAAASANAAPASGMQADATASGRELSTLFLAGDLDAVRARFSPSMQAAMDAEALEAFRGQVAAQLGEETSVLSEVAGSEHGMPSYRRVARWSRLPQPVLMQWLFDAGGRVAGFQVVPESAAPQAATSPYLDRETKASLHLPFAGDWYVFWGGRSIDRNYHAADRGQRFAYDFVRHVDGRSHTGDGTRLEDYHCWDQPILAPAGGRVVAATGNLPDQAIGTTNAFAPAGNHLVLDLGHGEYVFLAHLRQGSLEVGVGDHVSRGQALGRCGNSGNTSEPHLHLHMQDSPELGRGDGLPAQFLDYLADGVPVPRGEPERGQVVRAPAAGDSQP
jgi:hypothetical protein